MLAFLKIIL